MIYKFELLKDENNDTADKHCEGLYSSSSDNQQQCTNMYKWLFSKENIYDHTKHH